MKRMYVTPQMEAVSMEQQVSLLAGSVKGPFDPTPQPGDGTGGSTPRSPELDLDDMEEMRQTLFD